jgi:hypothetical protein
LLPFHIVFQVPTLLEIRLKKGDGSPLFFTFSSIVYRLTLLPGSHKKRCSSMRGRIQLTVLIVLAVATAPLYAAEVYEWKDAQGVDHMSDTPPPTDAGVELVRVNGNTVNTFDMGAAGEPAPVSQTGAPVSAPPQVPRSEEDCAQIHGRACDWDNDWSGYAYANCNRVGDGYCDDDAHLRAFYDPRVQAERMNGTERAHR